MQAAAAAEGRTIGIGSGYRTVEQQVKLRKSNGCPDVWTSPASSCRVPTAIPGSSNHNHGLAIDITGDKAWANANGARFGLHFPVPGEDWHIELIDDDDARGFVQGAQQMGAIGFDVDWMGRGQSPEEAQDALVSSYMDVITGAQQDALLETPSDPMLATPEAPEVGTPAPAPEDMSQPELPEMLAQPAAVPQGRPQGGGSFEGNVPPPGFVPSGEGVDRWRDVAIAALRYTGQDPALVDILLKRMGQESGGNPRAINEWDSNAKRGDPSKGLMQNIGSAFPERARELAGRGIYDGFANIVASIRYTLNRYGSLTKGYGRPGGY